MACLEAYPGSGWYAPPAPYGREERQSFDVSCGKLILDRFNVGETKGGGDYKAVASTHTRDSGLAGATTAALSSLEAIGTRLESWFWARDFGREAAGEQADTKPAVELVFLGPVACGGLAPFARLGPLGRAGEEQVGESFACSPSHPVFVDRHRCGDALHCRHE